MLCNFKWLIIKVDDAREVQGERSVQARLANAEPQPSLAVQ